MMFPAIHGPLASGVPAKRVSSNFKNCEEKCNLDSNQGPSGTLVCVQLASIGFSHDCRCMIASSHGSWMVLVQGSRLRGWHDLLCLLDDDRLTLEAQVVASPRFDAPRSIGVFLSNGHFDWTDRRPVGIV